MGSQVPRQWWEQAGMDFSGQREAVGEDGDGNKDGYRDGDGDGDRSEEGGRHYRGRMWG